MGIFMLTNVVRKGFKGINYVIHTAQSRVNNRVAANSNPATRERRQDILDNLLAIVSSKGKKLDFGVEDVKNEAFAALTAGVDATAVELQVVFYYFMKHRIVYDKVQREVDQAVQEGKLSDLPTYSQSVQLPLVKAVIKESLRLHPSVGFPMPRVVHENGIELSGMFIPPGTKFRPERWIRRTDGDMERCNNLVFGAGTRTCIGKPIALLEIYKVVPLLLRKFDFTMIDSSKTWTTHNYFFNKQTGIRVRVTARDV